LFLNLSKIDISQNMKFLLVCVERSTQHDCSAMFVVESTAAFCSGASGANRRTIVLERARLDGQALFLAGSDFPERVKVFLHESLRPLIRPIQADT
jgi:hypothetical protein